MPFRRSSVPQQFRKFVKKDTVFILESNEFQRRLAEMCVKSFGLKQLSPGEYKMTEPIRAALVDELLKMARNRPAGIRSSCDLVAVAICSAILKTASLSRKQKGSASQLRDGTAPSLSEFLSAKTCLVEIDAKGKYLRHSGWQNPLANNEFTVSLMRVDQNEAQPSLYIQISGVPVREFMSLESLKSSPELRRFAGNLLDSAVAALKVELGFRKAGHRGRPMTDKGLRAALMLHRDRQSEDDTAIALYGDSNNVTRRQARQAAMRWYKAFEKQVERQVKPAI